MGNTSPMHSSSARNAQEIVIRPPSGVQFFDALELFRYRALLFSMARRLVKSEFNELYLGFFWAVARPILMTLVFVFIRHVSNANFGAQLPSALYIYSGLIIWFYFTESLSAAATSMSRDAGLIQKVYFPRLISPMTPILANLVSLAVAAIPLALLMAFYGVPPGWNFFWLPVVLLQCMMLAFGIGCIFAALRLYSDDWTKFLNLLIYVGMFMSPVIYTPDLIPDVIRDYYFLNPASGMLGAFRSVLFSGVAFPIEYWLYAVIFSIISMAVGLLVFRRAEYRIIDKL